MFDGLDPVYVQRVENGNTLVSIRCTSRIAELDHAGNVAWEVGEELEKDPYCFAKLLPKFESAARQLVLKGIVGRRRNYLVSYALYSIGLKGIGYGATIAAERKNDMVATGYRSLQLNKKSGARYDQPQSA